MALKSKNRKFIAGIATVLSLGIAIFYYFYTEDGQFWEKWLPVGLFFLIAVFAFIRYRSL